MNEAFYPKEYTDGFAFKLGMFVTLSCVRVY